MQPFEDKNVLILVSFLLSCFEIFPRNKFLGEETGPKSQQASPPWISNHIHSYFLLLNFTQKQPTGYSCHHDWSTWRKGSRYLPCPLTLFSQLGTRHWLWLNLTHTSLFTWFGQQHLFVWQLSSLQWFYFIGNYLECPCKWDIFKLQLQWITSRIFHFLRLNTPESSFSSCKIDSVFLWSPVQTSSVWVLLSSLAPGMLQIRFLIGFCANPLQKKIWKRF